MSTTTPPDIVHNQAANRFEMRLGSELALVEYKQLHRRLAILHTEVPEAHSGQGIASQLARTILEYAREQQLSVLPYCPYVKAYIERHPEYQDLVKSHA